MTENNNQGDNERIILFQRLMQKKDQVLQVSCEIEDLRKQFISQGNSDEDGTIEMEIFKRIYSIMECLSEMSGYTQGKGLSVFHGVMDYFGSYRLKSGSKYSKLQTVEREELYAHIATSPVLEAMCIAANSANITWYFKREPSVSFERLESLAQILKLYKS